MGNPLCCGIQNRFEIDLEFLLTLKPEFFFKNMFSSMKKFAVLICLTMIVTICIHFLAGNIVFAEKVQEKIELSEKQKTTLKAYEQGGEAAMKSGWHGSGGYFSITKVLILLIGFWVWVFMIDWMNCDAETLRNPNRLIWNSINCGLLFFFGIGTLLIPIFWVGLGINFLAFLAPLVTYTLIRNKPLPPHERVLTPDHLRFLLARWMTKGGVKGIRSETKQHYEMGTPLVLKAMGKNLSKIDLDARTMLARNHEGYNQFRFILSNAIFKRATAVMFDFSETETQIRFQIDGVWHQQPPLTREASDAMLEAAKLLVGTNPKERRKRQEGRFSAQMEKDYYEVDFASQGVQTGEKAIVQFQNTKVSFSTPESLGLVDPELAKVRQALALPAGLVVFSAPVAGGLRSTTDVALRAADRFTRDFVAVEDKHHPYQVIENIAVNCYDSAKEGDLMAVLRDIFFKEPQVVVLRDMAGKEALELCCHEIENTRLIISTVRARDNAEAIDKFLALGVAHQLFASKLSTIVSQRLIRTLCPDCKEKFQPPPALLQKMGIPQGSVGHLYRVRSAPQEGEKWIPCAKCNDIGYYGRTAMFDVLEINDAVRKVIMAGQNADQLRVGLQQIGHRGFLPSGVAIVARGLTSIEELTRALKS